MIRSTTKQTVSVTTALGTTEAIPWETRAGGTIFVPVGATSQTLAFYAAPDMDGTFLVAYDDAATPAAITLAVVAERSYPIPVKLYGAGAIKIVAPTGAVELIISRKD
jgi:hypothetical protein